MLSNLIFRRTLNPLCKEYVLHWGACVLQFMSTQENHPTACLPKVSLGYDDVKETMSEVVNQGSFDLLWKKRSAKRDELIAVS